MKRFVQVYLRTSFVLAIGLLALMLVGNTASAQTRFEMSVLGPPVGELDSKTEYQVEFTLKDESGTPQVNVPMEMTTYNLTVSPKGPWRTDKDGKVRVNIQIINPDPLPDGSPRRTEIIAQPVPGRNYNFVRSAMNFTPDKPEEYPIRIIVLPPNSPGLNANTEEGMPVTSDPTSLAVGDTFYQQVWIKNVKDLSAWQMDIAFNPQALEATQVTEGDFLADGGYIPFFESTITTGGVSASEARIGQTTANGNTSLTNPSPKGASGTGHLLTIEFTVLEFAEGALGLHNVQLSNSEGKRISYYTVVNPYVVTHQYPREDVNRDGEVNIMDLVVVASLIGQSNPDDARADVNNDGMVNVLDLIAISHHTASWSGPVTAAKKRDGNEWEGAAPAARVADISAETIRGWIDLAQAENDGSIIFNRGIANLQRLLASEVPSETRLLLNYPNPFNPETWIPYQLAEAAEVSLTIYSVNGELVRTLSLGHQPAGLYQNRSQAAYWDGRTELGTQVASGIYFYTLKAGDFSSTRKMIVRK